MNVRSLLSGGLLAATHLLTGCGGSQTEAEAPEAAAEAADYERGPHGGRLLRDGGFAVEITIFEDGVDPELRVYPYRDNKPLDPRQVRLVIELGRLVGRVDRFPFASQDDFSGGDGEVVAPHSFDVRIQAVEGGRTHRWAYESYEGRTTLTPEAARAGGIAVERAGPATIGEGLKVAGRVEMTPEGRADVRARLPGQIVSMNGRLGETVRRGQTLVRAEANHSLQTYSVPAPISGVIVEKNANVGKTTGDRALFVLAAPTQLHGEFFIFPRDAERIHVGQRDELRSLSGEARLSSVVEAILPTADIASRR